MTDWRAGAVDSPEALKACCVAAYESEWVSLLLGDSWHPGGMTLTHRAGDYLRLAPDMMLLDVACGRGASLLAIAQRFGCSAIGVDLSASNIETARAEAERAGLSSLARFEVGDAERLPLTDRSVDALLCECAFCTFPSKPAAAAEFARVLTPGGRLCLTDVTRDGPLPAALDSLLAQVACIADARSLDEYGSLLEAAGVDVTHAEAHPAAVRELLGQVRFKLLAAEIAVGLGKLAVSRGDLREAKALLRAAAEAVDSGVLGYGLVTGVRR